MKLYDSRSEDQFLVKYDADNLEVAAAASGICLGQSLVWCKKMLEGKAPNETKPVCGEAAAVATGYLWALRKGQPNDSALSQACAMVSLTTQSAIQGHVYTQFWQITHNPGVYLLTIQGHAMAAACLNNRYYFYDPSDGLYEYESTVELNKKMLTYNDYLGSRKLI